VPLGTEVGLSPGDIILDGDPAPPTERNTATPLFGPCLVWPKGWMDQNTTWYGGRYFALAHGRAFQQLLNSCLRLVWFGYAAL